MGFTLSTPDKQYRLDSEAAVGPQTPTDPTMFEGSGAAVGTGVVGGLAATARATSDLSVAYAQSQNIEDSQLASLFTDDPQRLQQIQQQSNVYSTLKAPLGEQIQAVQDWAKADPSTQGAGARVLGSTARGITILGTGSLFGGPVGGASTLAGVEGYSTYRDVQEGPNPVDSTTALKMAGITGAANFAGAFLPLHIGGGAAKGLAGLGMNAEIAGNAGLAKSLFGAAQVAATAATNPVAKLGTAALINTGFGVTDRYVTSQVLSDAGYKDMAAQYAPLDSEALSADLIMGLAFGTHAEIAPHVEALRDRLTNGAAPPGAVPPPSLVDAALASRRQDMLARNGVGVPIDPMHANIDADLQHQALENLLRGRDVSVSPDDARQITEGALPDPGRGAINDEFIGAMEAQHGLLADFSEPAIQSVRSESADETAARLGALPEPPLAPGSVRLYHGGQDMLDVTARDVAPGDRRYAEGYALKSGAEGTVFYHDIPKTDPRLMKAYDDEGTSYEAPYAFFRLHGDEAASMRRLDGQTSRSEVSTEPAGAASVSPIAAESLRQIAANHADMPVELGNGATVRAADLPTLLAREMAGANDDAKLHDVAMACFLRTQ